MSRNMCIWRHKLCNAKTGVSPTFTWSNEAWYMVKTAKFLCLSFYISIFSPKASILPTIGTNFHSSFINVINLFIPSDLMSIYIFKWVIKKIKLIFQWTFILNTYRIFYRKKCASNNWLDICIHVKIVNWHKNGLIKNWGPFKLCS